MSTELHWPRRSTFTVAASQGPDDDEQEYRFEGPGTFEVPDQYVDQFLNRGWEQPDQADSEEAPAAATQDGTEPDAEPESGAFDAGGFVDESWQSVVAAIEDGEADGNLEAVREAEQNRAGDPRSSVIEAVEERAG